MDFLKLYCDFRDRAASILLVMLGLVACSIVPFVIQADGVNAQAVDPNAPTPETQYVLGPQDKIRVKVFAWRPARDEVFEWKALNDTYTVGSSGLVSFPLIGELRAGGSSAEDLSYAISQQMKTRLGLVEAPLASVEVVEFRPFYVLGAVQRPGAYPYRPGLILIQALSIAGGVVRMNDIEAIRLDREAISTEGERRVMENEIRALLAKRARLEAEASGATTLEFPAFLSEDASGPALRLLLQEELDIFHTRRNAAELRMNGLTRMKSTLQNDIASIQDQIELYVAHATEARDDLKQIDGLYAKKLTTTNRRADASRNLIQVEAERRRLQSSLTTAQHELSRVEMEIVDLRDARRMQATVELRTTQARLDELSRRYQTAEKLLQDALIPASTDSRGRSVRPTFKIIRQSGGSAVEITATETTVVRPGDTIKVEMPAREAASSSSNAVERSTPWPKGLAVPIRTQ